MKIFKVVKAWTANLLSKFKKEIVDSSSLHSGNSITIAQGSPVLSPLKRHLYDISIKSKNTTSDYCKAAVDLAKLTNASDQDIVPNTDVIDIHEFRNHSAYLELSSTISVNILISEYKRINTELEEATKLSNALRFVEADEKFNSIEASIKTNGAEALDAELLEKTESSSINLFKMKSNIARAKGTYYEDEQINLEKEEAYQAVRARNYEERSENFAKIIALDEIKKYPERFSKVMKETKKKINSAKK